MYYLKTRYPQGLNNIDPYHQFCFSSFNSFYRIYGICLLFLFFWNFIIIIIIIIIILEIVIYRLFLFPISPFGYYIIPLRRFFLVAPRPVTCLLFLLFLFVSSYYLGRCSFSPQYSSSGNLNCRKGFLLIVSTIMLQNYYDGKVVK